MKTKHGDLVAKVLITAVIVVLAGLLIAWMAGVFKDKKQDLNSGTGKINNTINSMADFDLQTYDGDTISGKTLTELIKEVVKKNPELSIAVKTLVNAKKGTPVTIYYNKVLDANNAINASGTATTLDQSNKSSDNYITPKADFLGEVLRNSNNEITGILFTQQK
jgi:FlaG/FlaF family flagellin (archaellin)